MMYFEKNWHKIPNSILYACHLDGLFPIEKPETTTRTQLVPNGPQILELELVKDDASPRRWAGLEFGRRKCSTRRVWWCHMFLSIDECFWDVCQDTCMMVLIRWRRCSFWMFVVWTLDINCCTSRDLSLKVHLHIVVNILLMEHPAPPLPYETPSKNWSIFSISTTISRIFFQQCDLVSWVATQIHVTMW